MGGEVTGNHRWPGSCVCTRVAMRLGGEVTGNRRRPGSCVCTHVAMRLSNSQGCLGNACSLDSPLYTRVAMWACSRPGPVCASDTPATGVHACWGGLTYECTAVDLSPRHRTRQGRPHTAGRRRGVAWRGGGQCPGAWPSPTLLAVKAPGPLRRCSVTQHRDRSRNVKATAIVECGRALHL